MGLNLGANKTSADRAADFAEVLAHAGSFLDFATVNVSSPNTEKLRDLQGPAALDSLLAGVMAANAALARPLPIFLKIAPDLDRGELAELVAVALERAVAAIVATNTTLARDGLSDRQRGEAGGLSGAPLFARSTAVLAEVYALSQGRVALVGVGGIDSAEAAYAEDPGRGERAPALQRARLRGDVARAAHPRRARRAARPGRLLHPRRGLGNRRRRLAPAAVSRPPGAGG